MSRVELYVYCMGIAVDHAEATILYSSTGPKTSAIRHDTTALLPIIWSQTHQLNNIHYHYHSVFSLVRSTHLNTCLLDFVSWAHS